MFLGQYLKSRRKELRLTQKELSNGITTQVTISEIENKNLAPNIKILAALCTRLGITLNDVVSDFSTHDHDQLEEMLFDAEHFLYIHKHAKALELIEFIQSNYEIPDDLTEQYYFIRADISLILNKDFDDAQFYFNLILNNQKKTKNTIFIPLAEVGTGISYFRKDEQDKALYYFNKAFSHITNDLLSTSENLSRLHFAIANISNFYSKIKDYQTSNSVAKYGIQVDKEHFSILSLDHYYHILAFNEFNSDTSKLAVALGYAQLAVAFATHQGNDYIRTHSQYFIDNHEFMNTK